MKETIVPHSNCPRCKAEITRVCGVFGNTPEPGDLTICANCGALLAFTADLTPRAANDDELEKLPEEARTLFRVAMDFFEKKAAR
jgi:hypothetical protein